MTPDPVDTDEFVFIVWAGNVNTFSDGADSILHDGLATLGLVFRRAHRKRS